MEKAYFEGDLYTIVTKLNDYILEPLDFIIKADNNLIDPVEVLRKIEKDKSKTPDSKVNSLRPVPFGAHRTV